jgi:hypothetical protein
LNHGPSVELYGGTVNYQTNSTDTDLVNKRLAHVKEYLTVAGCDMDRVQVKTGLSGGRGIPANKAMEIDAKGTANPNATGGGAASGFTATKPVSGN